MLNIEFPQYYKLPVGEWLVSEGFMMDNSDGKADRRELYLAPAVTVTHIVFSLCRVSDDKMVCALKMPRHARDESFVRKIVKLCFKS